MQYQALGRTGLQVSKLCLGTMMFGVWGDTDEAACRSMVDIALDHGVNFIDTADVYARGQAEQILGRSLRGRRDQVVLATKANNPMDDDPNHRGNSRRWLVRALDDSLRRLHTDWIDLYQVHRPDEETDLDDTLGVLSDLVRQGKVRALGTSTFPAEALLESAALSERRGRERVATEQPPYSIFARRIERDVLPVAQRLGLGVLVWAPLNGGWLTGKYRRGRIATEDSRAVREAAHFDYEGAHAEAKLGLVEELMPLADEVGCSLTHLAVAFTLAHPAVTSAIVGPRTPDQMLSVLGAPAVTLPTWALDRIDQLVPPGTTLNPRDDGYLPPGLTSPGLRRRSGS